MSSKTLRVAVDARDLATQSAFSGIGSYTRHLLDALAARDDVDVEAIAPRDLRLPDQVRHLPIRRHYATGRRSYIEHALRLPVELAVRSRAAVLHNPSFYPPFAIRRPWVQTLHDVIPLLDDDPDLVRLRAWWQRFGRRYRRADAVIAVSGFAAATGISALGLDASRVHVVHHGVSAEFRPDGTALPSDPPYLLVVSEFSERKGFDVAFEIIGRLADAGYPHRLCIAGRVRPETQTRFDELVAGSRHPERINPLGYVDDLPAAYRGADAVLISSRSEGFGLPAIEAMACGTPLVSFDNSSLGEVIGSGGVLVRDGDVDAMVDATRALLDDPLSRDQASASGLARAAEFTWARCADQTVAVYRAIT